MSPVTPRNPDYAATCRASFERQALMRTIGCRMVRIEPGRCELHLPFRSDLTQQHGYLHAGVVATVADNAGGYAALSLMPPGHEVLAVEFKVNFLAPARGDLLIARAQVLKSGRTLSVCAVDVHMRTGDTETRVAAMQQTLIAVAAG